MNEKILDQIDGKYKIALLTTFNFDPEYFDNQIFYKFLSNGIKDILIFADFEQLQESLNQQKTNIGIKYSVIPFRMNKSFHSKVVLLLDDLKAKLIVGSLNLTEKGYSLNQEIFNVFVYDSNNPDNLNLIISACNFFKKIIDLSKEKDFELISKINEISYLKRSNVKGTTLLLNNLEESIYNQVVNIIDEKIIQIDIAVPYYDNDASALKYIEENNSNTVINLYVQNEKSTFPQKYYQKYKDKIFKFKKILCNECGNFYHGKVFRFITEKNSYILYGSTNCTNAAIIKSFKDGGNVECDILEKGSIHEFDDFFNQFEEDYSEFISFPIIEDNVKNKYNYSFEELIKEENIECIIKYKEKLNNIQILIDGVDNKDCTFNYKNNRLHILIPKNLAEEIGNVFQLKIVNLDDKTESIINCFYNNYDAISSFRNEVEDDKNIVNKILFKNDIFINDIIDLMYQMPNNAADAKKIKDTKENYLEQKKETEESISDEEYIINEELLLEYKKKYDEDYLANRAFHKIGNSYYTAIRDIINFDNDKYIVKHNVPIFKSTRDLEQTISINLDVSDEELEIFNRRKGKRIVKKIVDEIITDSYKEEVNYYDYKAYVGLINIFFDKYTDYRSTYEIKWSEDNKKDYLLEYKDVAVSKFKLANSLVDILIRENIDKENEKQDILLMCIQAIIQVLYSLNAYELNDKFCKYNAEKLIQKLDSIFHIRDSYVDYLKQSLIILNKHKETFSFELLLMEFESLFKYKSLKGLLELINFKEEHNITINNCTFILNVKTPDILSFVNVRLEVLKKELNNYFKYNYNLTDNIESFVIIVNNSVVNLNNYNPILSIRLIWNNAGFTKIKDTKLNKYIIEESINWIKK